MLLALPIGKRLSDEDKACGHLTSVNDVMGWGR